jgi:hypothetical protein
LPEPRLRPEIRDALWRGREALAGAALILMALWLALGTFGVTRWVAAALGLVGLGLVWTGTQRWRFAVRGKGPGVVEVDERRLVYWGPLAGGTVDLDDLLRLELDRSGRPSHWVLTTLRGEVLAVPVNAEGAEALLDLFTALPGLHTEALLGALEASGDDRVVLWTAPNVVAFPRSERRRLH